MKKRILLLSFIALSSMCAFAQNVPSYVPSNGLVGWWPFNGNANDESGNGNNGTVNGATLTTDRFGSASSSYNFTYNGWIPGQQKDEIYIPYNANFNSSNLTVSTWINPSSITYNNGEAYFIARFENGYSNPNGQVWAFAMTPNNSVIAGINQASTTNNQTNTVVSGNPINLNNWVNVIFTYNGSVLKIFQNGFLISSQNNAILINTLSNSGISIGVSRQANGWWYPFDGKIDDIGIWNRALTECEIQDLYHAQLNSASMSISAGADQSICAGDNIILNGTGGSNYQWNNNVVDGQAFAPTQSNAYVVTAQDTLGCTGSDTVVVTILETATSTLTETSLDSYTLNGQTYTQSGTYTQNLTAANGCDSTITLNLTLNFTGIDELGTSAKKLVKITDLNGKIMPRRKNTLMLFIYEDGTVERVVEME